MTLNTELPPVKYTKTTESIKIVLGIARIEVKVHTT